VQHSIDHQFADRSGLGNADRRVNHPDVLCDREESSQRLKQIEEHIVMVGWWPCKVSSNVHINGQRVSEPVWEDKGKAMVRES
jgi:hypothetical protein